MSKPHEGAAEVLARDVMRLINERERLLYWLCRAWYECGDKNEALSLKLHTVLESFGYDADRVIRTLELGEPTAGR